ncbi:MAG TPA: amidohydrolase family protein [Vicinamibacterales bacterium]|nr:amidohydrolase family protein [Vicinamibacterales bacterium]
MKQSLPIVVVTLWGAMAFAQPQRPVVYYEGARVIVGDGSPAIAAATLAVQDGRIVAVGAAGSLEAPAGAVRVDLTGKTVMPAMVNVHVHMGYEKYTSWDVANHTVENVRDHLLREAFYGVAATTAVGSSPTEQMLQFRRDQLAGKYPGTSRLIYMPGMAPPNGGPDEVLRVATNQNHAIYEVTTPAAARAAVDRLAGLGLKHVKMWVDDRRGTYPKFNDETWHAIIEEGHARQMTVHAHAIALADQKAVVKAGVDVLVHMVQREPLDDEYLTIVREKKPYWATVIGLGDPTEVCRADPFFEQALPDSVIARIRATMERKSLAPSCGPPAATAAERERQMAINFPQMLAAGARVVLATDTGIQPGHTFGSGEHVELARWVQLGMSPAEAIVAATSRPAALMGQQDLGTLAAGKRASFIVLDANPLDDIKNTRRIADVYLDGTRIDRAALAATFKRESR